MPLAQFLPNFPVVAIKSDWTTSANILADVEAAWGIDFGSDKTFLVCVWEGPTDPDDYARYSVNNGTVTALSSFTSLPAVGTNVYIMDFYWS